MTIVAKRFCSHPGCNNLVEHGACPRHRITQMQAKDTKTDEERKFYSSNAWRKLSEAHRKDEPLCRECAQEGKVVAATVTDHIVPVRQGVDPYDSDNLQSLCDFHHQQKRAHERHSAPSAAQSRAGGR